MADSFFSANGQERRRALNSLDETAMEYLRYFLGPTGIPDRLAAASQVVDAVSPVSGTLRSMEAAGEGRYLDSALEGAGVVAPAGIAAYLARAGKAAAPYVAGAVDEGEAALRAMFGMPEGAVIRPDDVFRGKGFKNDVPEGVNAVRVTGDSQIEDMIRSGLLRPPEGGYPNTGKGTVYFHSMEDTRPRSVLHTPKVGDPKKNYSIVADAELARSKGEPLTLDDISHIWTMRDGEMVDVLDEIRRKNREYDTPKFADGGPVSSAPNRMTAYQNARASEAQAAPAPSTSILDLDPDAFVAALDELGLPPEERAFVEQQYFAKNRALPMTERPEGKRVGMVAPMAWEPGMTGSEALMTGEFDFTTPEFLRGMYEAPAEALNVAGATLRGIPVTEDQMQQAATDIAATVTGVGPTRAVVTGRLPERNVVSMSGIGDNGGPPLDDMPSGPRRYINPQSGLYSPSYEAAKALPQEVGTPQQMRSMLLKGGAKEEELVYSGFDNWLKGKDKVTKQEIEDVLFDSAVGLADSMPYVRVSNQARAGVTGVQGMTLGHLRNQLADDLRRRAIDERDAQLESELQGRGYRPIRLADENEYRQMADRVRALYDNPQSRGGLGPNGERLPPARVMNAITQIDWLMRRRGLSFENREVQRILGGLADDYDYVIGPSGMPEFTDDVIRRELPDFAQNPYYGSLPMRTTEEIADRVYSMSEQDVADELGISVEDMLTNFDPGRSMYGSYVVPGMRNYSENQYFYRDEGRGVLSGIEALGARRFDQSHFNAEKKPLMFFTLTGELNTPEGPAYHLAQLQSDIGQTYNENPNQFFVPGSTPETSELTKPQRQILREYVDIGKRMKEADDEYGRLYNEHIDKYMGSDGMWQKDAPGYAESRDAINNAVRTRDGFKQQLLDMDDKNWDFLYGNLVSAYQTPQLMSTIDGRGLSPGEFDLTPFEEILSGKAVPTRGPASGKTAALPFATSTNRWLDAAFKNELINAAKAGAEWVTIPKGDDVQKYTYGDIKGQRKFYGGPDERGIAPTRLKNLVQKLIPFETEFREIDATGYGPNAPTYKVFGMRLTPEIRKFLLEEGLPSFAKGGPVSGSSLDVDVFAFP